jgi:hypothetical protein
MPCETAWKGNGISSLLTGCKPDMDQGWIHRIEKMLYRITDNLYFMGTVMDKPERRLPSVDDGHIPVR